MPRPLLRAVWLAALVTAGSAFAADPPDKARPLLDLHYGDVLFHYFDGDDFEALTRLMTARAQGRAQPHQEDGDLLMAGLLLSLGQTRDAFTGFERLLQNETRPQIRNQAWLEIARLLHKQNANAESLAALDHIDAPLEGDLEADRQMLHADLLIQARRFDDAVGALQAWKTGSADWMVYARYNLGVALIGAGEIAAGEQQLDEVDRSLLVDEEQQALRDRANTALGYTHLQAGEWEAARTALNRVRLRGPSSNDALLGLGWAQSSLGHDRDALVPWMELASRDTGDRAVQEALLAVPYATARAGAPTAAADRYEDAFKRYEDEYARLAAISAAVDQAAFVDRLIDAGEAERDAALNDGRPFAPLARLPDRPEYRALSLLIASDKFQNGLDNARWLRFLRHDLDRWARRVQELSVLAPSAGWPVQADRIGRLSEACDQMLSRQRRQLQDLATAELQQHLKRLRDYQSEARFALAHVMDRSANLPSGKPLPEAGP